MTKVIAFTNQKGGTGKSTTALIVGQGLALHNKKILLIDLDAQQNLTYSSGVTAKEKGIMEVLVKKNKITEVIQQINSTDIIPATDNLSGADIVLNQIGKEYKLRESLEEIKTKYDYILIDTPPALSILTINALVACNLIVIPAQADIYSLQGISQLSKTINTVKQYCNHSIKIDGILLTRFNNRAILSKDMSDIIENIAKNLKTKLYKTRIRECITIKEAQAKKESIFFYAPTSNATIDYNNFIKELINE